MERLKKINPEAAAKIGAMREKRADPERVAQQEAVKARALAMRAAHAGANLNVDGKTGSEVIALIKEGNPGLFSKFLTDARLYDNDPESVHDNIELFMSATNILIFTSLFRRVADRKPSVLIPYLPLLLEKVRADGKYCASTFQIFEKIAKDNPNIIYPYVYEIRDMCSSQPQDQVVYAQLVGKLANCSDVVAHGPDFAFGLLIAILEQPHLDNHVLPVVMNNVSNIMANLSTKQILLNAMPLLTRYRHCGDIVFNHINDFANDRSLEKVSEKVDALEQRVNALNGEVSRTCANMADVIAYVDANMADMKDFLAEVVKKLPQPTRLQVDGRLRKTLILVFVCCETGLEYGITSTEWSKWLKIGFSLIKAGTAVIDLGMGNPLGIVKKGVDCVQEIYQAYKTNEDDEFNTYITQPFLTSSEQDKLIEKLREQKFFEKFAYNAQKHAWYLLNPQVDGQTRFNAADLGLVNDIVGAAADSLSLSGGAKNALTLAADTIASRSTSDSAVLGSSSGFTSSATSPIHTNPSSPPTTYISGGRAAAMKEQFKETHGAGVVNAAEAKVEMATVQAKANSAQADLVKRMEAMEDEIKTLKCKVAFLEQKNSRREGGCCSIT